MRSGLIALWVAMLVAASLQAEDPAAVYELDGRDELFEMKEGEARSRGAALAERDFAKGVYRVLVFGLRPESVPAEEALLRDYGVHTVPIAGCIVSEGIMGFAESYNAVMRARLEKRFGRDVLAEAHGTSEADHPGG